MKKRIVVGIGQAGIDILDNIARDLSIPTAAVDLDRYSLHSSKADHTVFVRETSDDYGRDRRLEIDSEIDLRSLDRLEGLIDDYDVVYIISALGGRAGGVILPAVAKKGVDMGKIVFGKLIIPFEEEKDKREIAEVYLAEIEDFFTEVDIYDNNEYIEKAEGEITLDSVYSLDSIFEEINRDILREIQRDVAYDKEERYEKMAGDRI
ncbi:MAG: hypothetical protein SVV03_01835 [Candidatus Nanohaloarchaea archaeon]|nr:hypothetical protein [Candidatus Nanohaloarchaea archaeon]